jgi:hypothetical protein
MAIKTPAQYREMEYAHLMVELATLLKPKVYCELGVKKGYTMNMMVGHVEQCIGVDIVDSSSHIPNSVDFYHMPSSEFSLAYGGPKIDFLFIDADHKYESVVNDIEMMAKHIRPWTSLVFLHDTYPVKKELLAPGYCNDAWKAAKYMRQIHEDWEIVTFPGPWAGFSILRYTPFCRHGWMDTEG